MRAWVEGEERHEEGKELANFVGLVSCCAEWWRLIRICHAKLNERSMVVAPCT